MATSERAIIDALDVSFPRTDRAPEGAPGVVHRQLDGTLWQEGLSSTSDFPASGSPLMRQ